MLFGCAHKPPACKGDKREEALNACRIVEAGWGQDADGRSGQGQGTDLDNLDIWEMP